MPSSCKPSGRGKACADGSSPHCGGNMLFDRSAVATARPVVLAGPSTGPQHIRAPGSLLSDSVCTLPRHGSLSGGQDAVPFVL